MNDAAGAFDAWGSSALGGLLGALFVVIGVRYAQYLADKRTLAADRRREANELTVQVSNLRDAVSSHAGDHGQFDMYPLRNRIYVAQSVLTGLASFEETRAFYNSVRTFRSWARRLEQSAYGVPAHLREVRDAHRTVLHAYADEVIDTLQFHLLDERVSVPSKSQLPALHD